MEASRRLLLRALGAGALAPAFLTACTQASRASKPRIARAPYVDGLSFLPEDINDIPAAKLDACICDISAIEEVTQADGTVNYKRTYRACMASIEAARARVARHTELLRLGLAGRDIELAAAEGKTALFFQIQGADCVEERLEQVDAFYEKGLRVLQLTHHYGNTYAGGALDNDARGGLNQPLTKRGHALIEKLNAMGVLIDLSHASARSASDAITASSRPVVLSHGAARAIVNHARCSPDTVIRQLADSGGVFGVFMMSFWLTQDPIPETAHYVAQLRHVANVGGIDAVAVANDFPMAGQENLVQLNNDNREGVKEYLAWWHSLRAKNVLGFDVEPAHVVIPELNHIDRMSRIHDAIRSAGFSASESDKIMGENWARVLKQVLT